MLKRLNPTAMTPVPPSVKLGGNGFPTNIAMNGERKVVPIAHPMIMGFDGMTHLLHLGMKFQGNLQLCGLMNHAGHLTIKKVVKNVVTGGVQGHGHGYTPGCRLFSWLRLPL